MKRRPSTRVVSLALAIAGLLLAGAAAGQQNVGEVFRDKSLDFGNPADRALAVQRIKNIEVQQSKEAHARARRLGLPIRRTMPDGSVRELVGFVGDEPLYLHTTNDDAAISTGANLIHQSPYSLDGSALIFGVWDAGSVLTNHQEFVGRVVAMDGAATHYHATHVGGTIGAAGVVASAKGMSYNTRIDSYDWNSDISEMTSRAAYQTGQLDTHVSLSNHSYSYVDGWDGNTWYGVGTDQNGVESDFGRYDSSAANLDDLAYKSPYYLGFWSAGNERNDNPGVGTTVTIDGDTYSYDPAIHPPGDGIYRNGFDCIGRHGMAKNIIAVGACYDAVTGSQRDPSKATPLTFSSFGPADDGRIKPDVIANGYGLYSTYNNNSTSYGTLSGTSMASPNACGSTGLLIDLYSRLFAGQAMRASTLKGLIIHTATDVGNPGPDYKNGWGLVDVKKAADLLIDHASHPEKQRLTEGQVSVSSKTQTYPFEWDEVSPIRATICWTDPAGASTTTHDNRSPRLVNDLNLKLVAPDNSEYFPFVMPFVGTWTTASMDLPATNGINNVDNVEQVLLESPGQAGTWQVVVSYTGGLANRAQDYGLILSGILGDAPPKVIKPTRVIIK